MFKKLTGFENIILFSLAFTIGMLIVRLLFTGDYIYFFYPWNLVLAVIPYLFSRKLKDTKSGVKGTLLLAGWLIFFPNAPYLITDVFHFHERFPVPQWYDLLLVVSGAWNGLIFAIASLLQAEQFLSIYMKPKMVQFTCIVFVLLCGYGVYIGRYWRFNSWDVVSQPAILFKASARSVIWPHHNLQLWAFTLVFAVLLYIIYLTVKQLAFINNKPVV